MLNYDTEKSNTYMYSISWGRIGHACEIEHAVKFEVIADNQSINKFNQLKLIRMMCWNQFMWQVSIFLQTFGSHSCTFELTLSGQLIINISLTSIVWISQLKPTSMHCALKLRFTQYKAQNLSANQHI